MFGVYSERGTRPARCKRAHRPHEETRSFLATPGRSHPPTQRVSTLTSQGESDWALETACFAVCQRHSWVVSWAAELRHNTRWVQSVGGGQSVINSMSLCLSRPLHLHNDAIKTEILLSCRFSCLCCYNSKLSERGKRTLMQYQQVYRRMSVHA